VKLYPFQKQMIDAILNRYTFSCPRAVGRTLVVEGIKSYIDQMHSQHRRWDNADINIYPNDIAEQMELPISNFKF
jgi:hypothetical protein